MTRPHIYQFPIPLGRYTNSHIVIANSIEELNYTYLYGNWNCSPLILITQEIRDEFKFTGYVSYNENAGVAEELQFDVVSRLHQCLVFNNKLDEQYHKIIIEVLEIIMFNWHE